MNEKDFPVESDDEENWTGAPASEAIWCGALSSLVQVTVVPALTVSVAGLNSKFLIVTASAGAAGDGVTVGEVAGL